MHIVNSQQRIEKIAESEYEFHFDKYFSEGWDLFRKDPGQLILYTLIMLAISFGLGVIPFLGAVAAFLIGPALNAGFYVGLRKIDQGEKVEIGDFFKAFDSWLQLFLFGLVSGLLVGLGLFLLVIPGIWLAVAISLGYPLVVFAKTEFWDSIKLSVKLVNKNWFPFFGLLIVLVFINLIGAIMLGLGLIITIPFTFGVLYSCYKDIVGFETLAERDLADHLVDDQL